MEICLKNFKIVSLRRTKRRAILLLFFCLSLSPSTRANPIPDLTSNILELSDFDSIVGSDLTSKSTTNQDEAVRKPFYQADPTSVRASGSNSTTSLVAPVNTNPSPLAPTNTNPTSLAPANTNPPPAAPASTNPSPAAPANANSTITQSSKNSPNQPPGSPPVHSDDDDDGSGLSSGAIAAIAISSIIGFLIILSVLAMSLRGIEHSIAEEKERKRAKASRQSQRLNPTPVIPVVVDSEPQTRELAKEV